MTAKEFNDKYDKYLEEANYEKEVTNEETGEISKEFIKRKHYGLDIGYPEVADYLDKLFQDLIKIPGFEYSQIKMKFGNPTVYMNGVSYEMTRAIELAIHKVIKRVESKEDFLDNL